MHFLKAVFFLLAILPQIAAAQTFPVERPTLKVGDQWTIEIRDPLTKNVRGARKVEVSNINESRVEVKYNGRLGVVTPDLTVLDSGTVVNDVGYQLLRFPLEAKGTWEFKTNWKNNQSGNSGTSDFKVAVVGTESLAVKAGTFDTVKLRATGNMTSARYPGKTWGTTLTYWYAPAAKQIVRYEWRDQYRDLDSDEELVAVKLAD